MALVRVSIRQASPIYVASVYYSGNLCHVRFTNGGSHWYKRADVALKPLTPSKWTVL